MVQKVTKYRDIEKRSATLLQLRSGKTIKLATSRAYVGKDRVLSQKEVDKGIAKVIKKKEDEQVAAIKRTERAAAKKRSEEAKAIREAEYKVACDAALASGLPKSKKPRAPTKLKTISGGIVVSKEGGGRGVVSRNCDGNRDDSRAAGRADNRRRGQVAIDSNLEVGDDYEELDEVEIEERQRILQIQEFFDGLE